MQVFEFDIISLQFFFFNHFKFRFFLFFQYQSFWICQSLSCRLLSQLCLNFFKNVIFVSPVEFFCLNFQYCNTLSFFSSSQNQFFSLVLFQLKFMGLVKQELLSFVKILIFRLRHNFISNFQLTFNFFLYNFRFVNTIFFLSKILLSKFFFAIFLQRKYFFFTKMLP